MEALEALGMILLAIGVDVIMTDINRASEESGDVERMRKMVQDKKRKREERGKEEIKKELLGFGSPVGSFEAKT